jgi:hypothetical protein
MASGPLVYLRLVQSRPVFQRGQNSFLVEVEASANLNPAIEGFRISVKTLVSPPFHNHPQRLELAALIRARDVIDGQIAAMTQAH